MAKLTNFNNFSDAFFSMQNFNSSRNNTSKYNKILSILKKIIENELTFKQRKCIKMYYNHNLSTIKISKLLGVYPSTVWRHIQKSRRKIRNIMKYYY